MKKSQTAPETEPHLHAVITYFIAPLRLDFSGAMQSCLDWTFDTRLLRYCVLVIVSSVVSTGAIYWLTRMWADAQRDGRPGEYKWRPLINAAQFG